jgi:hypothetical protein
LPDVTALARNGSAAALALAESSHSSNTLQVRVRKRVMSSLR